MEDLAAIGSRLSPRAIWHLKQANETSTYEVVLGEGGQDWREDEKALMQLVDDILLILDPRPPDGWKMKEGQGQCYTISDRGRQVLQALSSSEPQGK